MRLRDMPPSGSVRDSADIPSLYAERIRDGLMCLPIGHPHADGTHEIVGEDGRMVPYSLLPPVGSHICVVLFLRSPSQIGKGVVRRISIAVQRLVSLWAGTDEGFKDKRVNVFGVLRPVLSETHDLPSVAVVRPRLQASPLAPAPLVSIPAPNRAVVARSVSGKSGDAAVFHRGQVYHTWAGFGPVQRRTACAF